MVADHCLQDLTRQKPPGQFDELPYSIDVILSKHRTYTPFS